MEPPPKPPLEPPEEELPPDLEPLEPLLPDLELELELLDDLELEPELLEEPELPLPLLELPELPAVPLLFVVELVPELLLLVGLFAGVELVLVPVELLVPALFATTAPAAAPAPVPATAANVELPPLFEELPLELPDEPLLLPLVLEPAGGLLYLVTVATLPFTTPAFARAAR